MAGSEHEAQAGSPPEGEEFLLPEGVDPETLTSEDAVRDRLAALGSPNREDLTPAEREALHVERGDLLAELGLVERALRDYRDAVRLQHSSTARRRLADSYFAMGLPQKAYQAYKKALLASPQDPESHLHMAEFLRAMGRTAWAIEEYAAAAKLDPERSYYHLRLGEACLIMGRLKDAVDALRESVRLDARVAYHRFRLANALARNDDIAGAAAELEVAVALEPVDDYYLALLSVCYGMLRRHRDALRAMRMAARVRPKNHAYMWLLAECHSALEQPKEAAEEYDRAGILDAYDRDYVHRLQGRFLKAAEWEHPRR